MTIHILAIGRMRKGPQQALFDAYSRRLNWGISVTEVEEKRRLPAAQLADSEGEKLLKALPRSARCVVLDSTGVSYSSEKFAATLAGWMNNGDIAFLIGGADGHTAAVKNRADTLLSLGAATWPHLLVRGMLMEQLYRAQCILSHHPYHRA